MWLIKVLVIKYNYPKGDKAYQTKVKTLKAKVKTSQSKSTQQKSLISTQTKVTPVESERLSNRGKIEV